MEKTKKIEQASIDSPLIKDLDDDIYFEKRSSVSNMTELHYHRHYELYYLLSGKQNYFIDNAYFEMGKGDLALIPKGSIHKTTNGMGGMRILLNFNDRFLLKYLSPRAIKTLFPLFDKRIVHPSADIAKNIVQHCDKFQEAYEQGEKDTQFLYLFQILLLLQNCPEVKQAENEQALPLIHAITEYTQKNYGTINSLNDVAEALYVSKYHICHLFSKHLDLPFNEYLTKVRLKNAEEKLTNTDQTVTEIAESCGFHTTTYFCSVFKKQFGISPLKYRTLTKQ